MKRALLLFLPVLMLLVGCVSDTDRAGRLRHQAFEYKPSGLDWIVMLYLPKAGDARFKTPVRLSFSSKGLITATHGRSPLVLDEMSTKTDDPNWNAIREERLSLSEQEWAAVIQVFVDEGLVPNVGVARVPEGKRPPRVRYAGTLGFERFSGETDNPFFLDVVEDFLETNFGPALRR